jgi:hypothetical protein
MDIDAFVIAIEIDHTSFPKKVFGSAMLNEHIQTSVRRRSTATHRIQTAGLKSCVYHSSWIRWSWIIDPFQ